LVIFYHIVVVKVFVADVSLGSILT
jgi:hypothetical protein